MEIIKAAKAVGTVRLTCAPKSPVQFREEQNLDESFSPEMKAENYKGVLEKLAVLESENIKLRSNIELLEEINVKHQSDATKATSRIEELSNELDELKRAERSAGYQDGVDKGYAEAKSSIDQHVSSLDAQCNLLEKHITSELLDLIDCASQLAFVALSKLVGERCAKREEAFLNALITNAVDQCVENPVTIYVNKGDFEVLSKGDLVSSLEARKITVKFDQNISPGGCRIESDQRLYDSGVERLLDGLSKVMVDQSEHKADLI